MRTLRQKNGLYVHYQADQHGTAYVTTDGCFKFWQGFDARVDILVIDEVTP